MNANYALLGFLDYGPNYGYELKKLYDNYFGQEKPILSGQIYSILSRLKRDNKIKEIKEKSDSNGPERIKYEITSFGKEDLEKWLNTPENPSRNLQVNLYIKTVIALLREGDAAKYLDEQKKAHIARMRELTKIKNSVDLSKKLLIDHALFHIEADLRWIDLTSSRLVSLKKEIL